MFSRRVAAIFAAVVIFGSLAALPGCDWFQGSEPTTRLSPFVSALGISPKAVLCAQEFTVSFRYDDPQGDIARARVNFTLSGAGAADREETPLWPETVSRASGTVSFPFSFPCGSKGGVWTITVQAEDDRAHTSNTLSGDIRLNAAG